MNLSRISKRMSLSKRFSLSSKALGSAILGNKLEAVEGSNSANLCQYRGVSMFFLKEFASRVLSNDLAMNIHLVTFLQDYNVSGRGRKISIPAGTTALRKRKLADDKVVVNVPFVGDLVVEPYVVGYKDRADWDVNDICSAIVLRRAKLKKDDITFASIIEEKHPEAVGKQFQGYYVIHSHSTKFHDLVASLEDHFRGRNLKKVFVWLDIFGANQNRVIYDNHKLQLDEDREEISRQRELFLNGEQLSAINRFAECLVYLPSLEDPAPFTRTWCLWEMYAVALHEAKVSVLFGEESRETTRVPAIFERTFPELREAIETIDFSKNSETYFEADKELILAAASQRGLDHVTYKVKMLLWKWMLQAAEDMAFLVRQRCSKGDTEPLVLLCKLYECQAIALQAAKRGMDVVEKFKDLRQLIRKYDAGQLEQAQRILRSIANIATENGSLDMEKLIARQQKLKHKPRSPRARNQLVDGDDKSAERSSLSSDNSGSTLLTSSSGGSFRNLASLWTRRSSTDSLLLEMALGSMDLAQELYTEGRRFKEEKKWADSLEAFQDCVRTLRRMGNGNADEEKMTSKESFEMNLLLREALEHMGEIFCIKESFADALDHYKEVLELHKEHTGPVTLAAARTLKKIAEIQVCLGELEDACESADESLNIFYRKGAGENIVEVAQIHATVGLAHCKQGNYKSALGRYEAALELFKEEVGETHELVAETLHSIATVHAMRGDTSKAVDTELLAFQAWKELHGEVSEKAGDSLMYLAFLLDQLGDTSKALETNQLAIVTYSSCLGNTHLKVGEIFYNMGTLLLSMNQPQRALDSYENALQIFLEHDHAHAGLTLNNMAVVYERLGKLDEAFYSSKEALKILEEKLGQSHPQTVKLRRKLHRVSRRRSKKLSERQLEVTKTLSHRATTPAATGQHD